MKQGKTPPYTVYDINNNPLREPHLPPATEVKLSTVAGRLVGMTIERSYAGKVWAKSGQRICLMLWDEQNKVWTSRFSGTTVGRPVFSADHELE